MAGGATLLGGENMNENIKGKIAVVIGGTGSIGESISLALLSAGAVVVATGTNKKSVSAKLKKEMVKNGSRLFFHPLNLLKEKNIKKLALDVLHQHEKIDILILASGIQLRKPYFNYSLSEWNQILAVNLTGTFLACKYLIEPMRKNRSGKVVGITSLAAEIGIEHVAPYAASKGGMTQFLKTIAVELAPYGVCVNMIAPGRIETEMNKKLLSHPKVRAANLARIPAGRFGKPEDLLGGVLFLVSDAANYMTGQTLIVDGGWLASGGNPQD